MKKRHILLITFLIAFLSVLLAGCISQVSNANTARTEQESNANTANTEQESNANTANAEQESPTDVVKNDTASTAVLGQSQFMPLVNSVDPAGDAQANPGDSSIALNPTAAVAPGEPPTPTLVWPTPANNALATPYVRPSGAQGQDLPPERWQEWPVLPVISDRALEIYRAGIAQGNDPTHFSKVGDCQNIHQYFLGLFDIPENYRLGDGYAYLQETIDYFSGSWSRSSEAVRTGFNVASVLAPLYANPQNCQPGETPLACEIRIWNPSFLIISMETWTEDRPPQPYENYLRQIVEYAISQNVMPVVSTKADNLEGDHALNKIVARVASDYDIPMWNFWAATDPLTDHGLMEDGFHLTNGPQLFDSPESLDLGWPVRNLTGLLAVEAVWKTAR